MFSLVVKKETGWDLKTRSGANFSNIFEGSTFNRSTTKARRRVWMYKGADLAKNETITSFVGFSHSLFKTGFGSNINDFFFSFSDTSFTQFSMILNALSVALFSLFDKDEPESMSAGELNCWMPPTAQSRIVRRRSSGSFVSFRMRGIDYDATDLFLSSLSLRR